MFAEVVFVFKSGIKFIKYAIQPKPSRPELKFPVMRQEQRQKFRSHSFNLLLQVTWDALVPLDKWITSVVFEAVNSLDLNKLILNCAYGSDFCLQKLSLYSKVKQEIEYMKV